MDAHANDHGACSPDVGDAAYCFTAKLRWMRTNGGLKTALPEGFHDFTTADGVRWARAAAAKGADPVYVGPKSRWV